MTTSEEVIALVADRPADRTLLRVRRSSGRIEALECIPEDNGGKGRMGVVLQRRYEEVDAGTAFEISLSFPFELMLESVTSLVSDFDDDAPVAGPIGTDMTGGGISIRASVRLFVVLAALGFFFLNLFPIPTLAAGRLLRLARSTEPRFSL